MCAEYLCCVGDDLVLFSMFQFWNVVNLAEILFIYFFDHILIFLVHTVLVLFVFFKI